ncbi:MAG: hypothetical protein L0Y79_05160 [Chlorobi bacterium]|nr:hypothetical protein [Chlorobiota bacterium]MCI0715975.1 hypothetical protein [Chlorobiota bacterium]
MKQLNESKQLKVKTREEFIMENIAFFWIFFGNGEFTQKHDENAYRRFVERNYQSKSNKDN